MDSTPDTTELKVRQAHRDSAALLVTVVPEAPPESKVPMASEAHPATQVDEVLRDSKARVAQWDPRVTNTETFHMLEELIECQY